MTVTQRLDRIPPNLCRLLARSEHGLRPLTTQEICDRSGLSWEKVAKISKLDSWASLLRDIESFSAACGVSLMQPKSALRFLKRRKRVYLLRAKPSQRRLLVRLIEEITQSARAQAKI